MIEVKKCTICGLPFVEKVLKMKNYESKILVPQCDCEEKANLERENQNVENERKEKARVKAGQLKEALNCPLVTPFFKSKTFDNLSDCNEHVKICQEYAQGFSKKSFSGMFMIGNVGTGKTTLQACICNELEKRGFICLLTTFSALLDYFVESCSFESGISTNKLFKTLTCFDYIVLDDIGREKYTDKRLEFAFRIIDTLMNYNVVVSITGNNEPLQKLGAIPEYKAIFDRLRDMCPRQMVFNGQSYRGRKVG